MEIGILALLALAAATSLVVPSAAILITVAAATLFLFKAPLRHAVIVFLCLLMFDLQRQVGGTWVYIDLSFAGLLIPLLRSRRMPPFWWVFVPYTAYLLIDGIPRAINSAWYFGFAVRSIIALIAYLACALAEAEDIYFIILGIVMIPLTVYGLYQLYIDDMGALFNWMNPHFSPLPWMNRSYSLLWQPNFFGGVTSVTLVSLLALAMKGIGPRRNYLLAFVSMIGLLCSGSRGGIIGALAGVIFAAILSRRSKLLLIVPALFAAVFLAGTFLNISVIQRLAHGDELANHGRWLGNQIGIEEFLQNPMFGLGPTNFEAILPSVSTWEYTATMPVNNTFLQHLAELGIIGFAAFWVPLCTLFAAAWRYREDPVVLACICMLFVFAVHGLFDYMLELGPSYLFLIYSCCGVLAGRVCKLSKLSPKTSDVESPVEMVYA